MITNKKEKNAARAIGEFQDHTQKSLQAVCAVGRHLTRYPVEGVAYSASAWHLQTSHTSDHCDLRQCGAL